MPAETVVVLSVVCGMFAIFMVVLGSVWIWTNLPEPAARKAARAETPSTDRDYRKAA